MPKRFLPKYENTTSALSGISWYSLIYDQPVVIVGK